MSNFLGSLQRIVKRQLFGTAIIGVLHTGDFDTKDPEKILEIYRRLSEGKGLLPPATGFILDREVRSEEDCKELQRRSKAPVIFLPRRMYENYLLNPGAISEIVSNIKGFRDTPVTVEEVEEWLEQHRGEQLVDLWLKEVHGAKMLKDIFEELSECRVTFDKVEHSVALTKWIIEHSPNDLTEIAKLIESILPQSEGQ